MEETNENQKPAVLVLIDSNAIIHRAYHALPKNMKTRKGELTNVIYGFTTTLIKVLEDLKPDYIAASFDVSKATFRLAEYKEYKATRVKADQELYDQIPRVRELLSVLNIPIYEIEGYEADDCIGTMVEQCSTSSKYKVQGLKNDTTIKQCSDLTIYIVTGDKDAFQLIDGNIFVYNLKHGLQSAQIVDRNVIKEEWNLQPEDFIDLKALAGDPSDNIPGAPGIGPKTAIDLLQRFDTIDKMYEKITNVISTELGASGEILEDLSTYARDDRLIERLSNELVIKPRILRILIEFKDQVYLSQRLATIRRDVPINFNLEEAKWGNYDKDKVINFFEEMQFKSLLKRFGILPSEEPKTKEAKIQKEKDDQLKLL